MSSGTEKKRVAVIGLSCRFAGADNPDELWSVMKNMSCEVAPMRFRFKDYDALYSSDISAGGKFYNEKACFLKRDIYRFDADFFEISRKEACHMDIQQRLLLEVSHEALEDAGLIINGTGAGVFVGGFMQDRLTAAMQRQNYYNLNQYDATGTSIGMLSGRISYFYDLHGPSITVDTACSSSLTALHYACESIMNGTCRTAICGGVNVLNSPGNFIALSKGGFLSKKSLCHAFGEKADGYVRGEGAGVLVLKELNKAIEDKDKIYCEIIASHINHDGRTDGITYPNGRAQIGLLDAVYRKSGISIDDIGYIEAHGTGTQAGDRTELKALGSIFSGREQKLTVGSVKTNIGHTEAAAGVASVIKSILILKNEKIPATLHSETKNPNIPFEKYNIRLAGHMDALPAAEDGRHYIGINGFGFGGSNAHVIIADVKEKREHPVSRSARLNFGVPVFNISAKNKSALYSMARLYANAIQNGSLKNNTLEEICACCATRRGSFDYRLSIIAENTRLLAKRLVDFQHDTDNENVIFRRQSKKFRKCAVIFSGMGVQTANMGRELYASFPEFKTWFDKCSDIYYKLSGIILKEYMTSEQKSDEYYNIEVLQPYNLAYQIALFKLIRRLGVEYDGTAGHSAGELAAFYCCGLVSLEDIFEIAHRRGKWQNKLRGRGKMLVLGISEDDAGLLCDKYKGRISIAAVNGGKSVVLSGREDALRSVEADMGGNVFARFLNGDIAYHSYQMDEIKEQFLSETHRNEPDGTENIVEESERELYSTVYGEKFSGNGRSAQYWWENIRNTVRFFDTIKAMKRDGYDSFIELGASPALKYYIDETFGGQEYAYTAFQQKEGPQLNALYRGMAEAYVSGMKIDWTVCFGKAAMIELPKYQWGYDTYNSDTVYNGYIINQDKEYAMLGKKMNLPVDAWESQINLQSHKWLTGHKIADECVLPGAAYIGMIAESGIKRIKNLNIPSPVMLPPAQDIILILTKYPAGNIDISFTGQDRAGWRKCCSAETEDGESSPGVFKAGINTPEISLGRESVYRILREKSLNYSGDFEIIDNARIGENFAVCGINNPGHSPDGGRIICIMDAMLQSAALAGVRDIKKDKEFIYLPQFIGGITVNETDPKQYENLRIYTEIISKNGNGITADISLLDKDEKILVSFRNAEFKPAKRNRGFSGAKAYINEWVKKDAPNSPAGTRASDGILFFAAENYLRDCMKLIDIAKNSDGKPLNLTVVTSNAVKVLENDKVENYTQAALWGLCRCIRLEYRNIVLKLADTDDTDSFTPSLLNIENCYEFAVRSGETYSLAIKKAGGGKDDGQCLTGTPVIVGASGGLAYRYALRLAERGAKNIALISRRKSDKTDALVNVLKYYRINAEIYFADAEICGELRGAFERIEKELPPLGSIYHLAGISKNALIENLDEKILEEHFAAKLKIAENICEIIGRNAYKNLYLFGSLIGLTGNIGQGAYGGANACLQSYGEHTGCRFIGYGALDTGMTLADGSIRANFEKQAIGVMDTEPAVSFADSIPEPCVYAADVSWTDFLKQANLAGDIKFAGLKENGENTERLTDRLRLYGYEQQMLLIRDFLKTLYAKALDTDADAIDEERMTNTMGINSLSSSLISNGVNREFDTVYLNSHVTGEFSIRDFSKNIYERIDLHD